MKIGNRQIGQGNPVYIIAELSANHQQNLDIAIEMVNKAIEAGADAIKLQTYHPDTITLDSNRPEFQLTSGLWKGQSLHQLYSKAYLPWEWTPILKKLANDQGVDLFSSPFDITAVDFLESLDVPAFKIASYEMTDHLLLRKVAQTKKPVIISSGMATLEEIKESIQVLIEHGTPENQISLLRCVSGYPTPLEDVNLATIRKLQEEFPNLEIGLSDHSEGTLVPMLATAMGISIIEKHFTLDKSSDALDNQFSLEPEEFKEMVDSVRKASMVLGKVSFGKSKSEIGNKRDRRSLYFVNDLKKGEIIKEDDVKSVRPGMGIETKYYWQLIGTTIQRDVEKNTPVLECDL